MGGGVKVGRSTEAERGQCAGERIGRKSER